MSTRATIVELNGAAAQALAARLRADGYLDARVLKDGTVAALGDLLFTRSIILRCDRDGWANRFCFADRDMATQRFSELSSEDDVPAGHTARRFGTTKSNR